MADTEDTADPASAADECYQAAADLDRQDLRLVTALTAMLPELRGINSEDCPELDGSVLKARDKALIAVCDRLRRIVRRDIPFG